MNRAQTGNKPRQQIHSVEEGRLVTRTDPATSNYIQHVLADPKQLSVGRVVCMLVLEGLESRGIKKADIDQWWADRLRARLAEIDEAEGSKSA